MAQQQQIYQALYQPFNQALHQLDLRPKQLI